MIKRIIITLCMATCCFADNSDDSEKASLFYNMRVDYLCSKMTKATSEYLKSKNSITDKHNGKSEEIKEKMYDLNEWFGWPLIPDTQRDYEKILEKMDAKTQSKLEKLEADHSAFLNKLTEELKDELSKPTDGDIKKEMKNAGNGTVSHEWLKMYNATQNLQKLGASMSAKLIKHPSDYELAEKLYENHARLTLITIAMYNDFTGQINTVYIPSFHNAIKLSEEKIRHPPTDPEIRKSVIKKSMKLQQALSSAIPILESYKVKNSQQIARLQRHFENLTHMQEMATAARTSRDAFAGFNHQASSLSKLVIPEIVDFELNMDDFAVLNDLL